MQSKITIEVVRITNLDFQTDLELKLFHQMQ